MYSLAACSPSSAAGSDTSSLPPLVTVLFELLTRLPVLLTRLAAGLTASIRHSWRPLAAGAVLSSAVKSLESGAEVFANLAKSADRSRGLVVRAGNVPEYASPGGSKKEKRKKNCLWKMSLYVHISCKCCTSVTKINKINTFCMPANKLVDRTTWPETLFSLAKNVQ